MKELCNFRFTAGEITPFPEERWCSPAEPIIRSKRTILQAQRLLETAILNIVNHQTLIATKASRVKYAAGGGRRDGIRPAPRRRGRTRGYGAGRPISGCCGTSCVLTGQMFDIPVKEHPRPQLGHVFSGRTGFFQGLRRVYPFTCLLVDTYDTLKSGVPNAITVFQKRCGPRGHEPLGIRLDSGDLSYLSGSAQDAGRKGFANAKIFASGDLDEMLIRDLQMQGAAIDVWAVGTKLITSDD